LTHCHCLRETLAAGEDAGRYVAARHGILTVVRRELHAAGTKYTAALGTSTAAQPPATTIVTAGA
jgi:hypothetical protein